MKLITYDGSDRYVFIEQMDPLRMKTLLTTQDEVYWGLVFRFSGKTYVVGQISPTDGIAVCREITIGEGEDKDYESKIICPYCGYADQASLEAGDSEENRECGVCGGVFSFYREVTVEYSTSPVAKPTIVDIKEE
jgi:hypothetical protein